MGSPRLLTNMRPIPVPTPNTRNSSQKLREAAHSHSFRSCFGTVCPTLATATSALLASLAAPSSTCVSSQKKGCQKPPSKNEACRSSSLLCSYYCYVIILVFTHISCREAGCVCKQAACRGCQNPTTHWTRQLHARFSPPCGTVLKIYIRKS